VSPTYNRADPFDDDWKKLTPEQRKQFLAAVTKLVADLKRGEGFRKGLRIKRVEGKKGQVYEMTWAPDGRATWEYGSEVREDEAHITWRRIGTHNIFKNP
jgi:hypothetical protein